MPPAPRAAARPLAGLWIALVVYATLFPFEGWRFPPGASLGDLLTLHWPRWWGGFDVVANGLGYLPIGLLLALASLRDGRGRAVAFVFGAGAGMLLSYGLEVTQQLLPQRVPSLMDWVLNSVGAAFGALLAQAVFAAGLPTRWQRLHNRWLGDRGGSAAVLLMLWPVALLFPTPMPLGLGQVGGLLQDWALAAVKDVTWAEAALAWLQSPSAPARPLSRFAEGLTTVLGLLAPCLVAYTVAPSQWRRIGLAVGASLVALAATTLSTALNFGPDHAFAWSTPGALTALGVGAALALALSWISPRLAAGLALVALTGLVVLVHQAPTDPYFAQSLQGWEQGRFIRFHGLARWVGWLWPYAAMAWLLVRLGRSA